MMVILGDFERYLPSYISIMVNIQWSLHSFFLYKNKYNKLTPILLILIHLFQPLRGMQASVSELNGTTCSVTYHWLIIILLLGISKNESVLATFCIPVLQQRLPIFIQPFHPLFLLLPPILLSPSSWASSKVKDK